MQQVKDIFISDTFSPLSAWKLYLKGVTWAELTHLFSRVTPSFIFFVCTHSDRWRVMERCNGRIWCWSEEGQRKEIQTQAEEGPEPWAKPWRRWDIVCLSHSFCTSSTPYFTVLYMGNATKNSFLNMLNVMFKAISVSYLFRISSFSFHWSLVQVSWLTPQDWLLEHLS